MASEIVFRGHLHGLSQQVEVGVGRALIWPAGGEIGKGESGGFRAALSATYPPMR
jgi:hypothetical protein